MIYVYILGGFLVGFSFHFLVEMIMITYLMNKKKLFVKSKSRWYPFNPYRGTDK